MTKRKQVAWCFVLALLLSLLALGLPIGGMLLADAFTTKYSCVVHEGYANPCVVGTTDYGDALYQLFVGGWFTFITMVIGALLIFVWLVLLVDYLMRKKSKLICWFWVLCLVVVVGEFIYFGYYAIPFSFYWHLLF